MAIRETIDRAKDSYGFSVHNLLIYDDDAMYYFKVFDPEHVALMESVVEAVMVDDMHGATYEEMCRNFVESMRERANALLTYRREHGLV